MSMMMLEVSSPFIEVVNGFAEKSCARCGDSKILTLFQRDRSKPDGRMNICGTCKRAEQRQREEIRCTPAYIPFNAHAR